MAYVNMTIFENPEDISWRVINALSQEQYYEYPVGNYNDVTSFMNFFNIESGIWEFEISRESIDSNGTAEIGYLNLSTGGTMLLAKLSFDPTSTATSATKFFLLE